jgi:protein SCO1/2
VRRLAVLFGLTIGCANRPASAGSDLFAVSLPNVSVRPRFTLTTTAGAPFDFGAATHGKLTYLFFGYTHCPDVCPATMANLGAVMNRLTAEERTRLAIVFVTTDPARDSAATLRAWLDRFDRETIGLTGSIDDVEQAERAAGIAVAIRGAGESYTVSHAAQVLVYSADDSGHVAYPFGTRQSELADDLPKLLGRWGARR